MIRSHQYPGQLDPGAGCNRRRRIDPEVCNCQAARLFCNADYTRHRVSPATVSAGLFNNREGSVAFANRLVNQNVREMKGQAAAGAEREELFNSRRGRGEQTEVGIVFAEAGSRYLPLALV